MEAEKLQAYIQWRLAKLEHQKNTRPLLQRGERSFGTDSTQYGHLPARRDVVMQKKALKRWMWTDALAITMAAVAFAGAYFDKFAQNWVKALLSLVVVSGLFMLFYVFSFFFSMFIKFRHSERTVRKLIYQDILFQLKKEEKEWV